jgi:hypothetical protein
LVKTPERKIPLGRHWRKWEDNIKINSFKKEDGREWIGFFWIRIESNGGLY